mgnify:FL=1
MNDSILRQFLLYSLIINYIILLIWFFTFIYAREFLRKLHGKYFNLSDQTFDAIHYAGMAIYKIAILLLNLIPFIAIVLMHKA